MYSVEYTSNAIRDLNKLSLGVKKEFSKKLVK